ncbi:MAG: hypothetical protein U5L45_03620 [Saprospiraceae bacterium]|nr:hypothetical protein [Saprospiraceae bacterium]
MVHFFGLCPKNEPHSPSCASEASARTSSLDFMYGFKRSVTKILRGGDSTIHESRYYGN